MQCPTGEFFRSLAFFVVVVCLFLSLRLLSLSRKRDSSYSKLLPRLHFEMTAGGVDLHHGKYHCVRENGNSLTEFEVINSN